MGTNYYMRYKSKTCDCCKRTDDELHIGKSSYGWSFSFRGYDYGYMPIIKSSKDWINMLEDKDTYIVDEYEDEISKDYFWNMVSAKEKDKSHALLHPNGNWTDDLGNSFTGADFS